MRYWMASAGDLSGLSIRQFALKASSFVDVHNERLKREAVLHGFKVS